MKYDRDKHHRKSIRLKGYDYSQNGVYFLTLCVQNRECLFGDIKNDVVELNAAGEMVSKIWSELPIQYPGVHLDEFVVMPNHFHGILVIDHPGELVGRAPLPAPLPGFLLLMRSNDSSRLPPTSTAKALNATNICPFSIDFGNETTMRELSERIPN